MTQLRSRRLDLPPLTGEALEALIQRDRDALETMTGARFPEPLTAPPLMGDALPFMRDALQVDPASAVWGPRLLVLRETRDAVGCAGFTGNPDADCAVTMGYSVYPAFQGRGLASEAASALVSWALTQPGIRRVRATIPPWHGASQGVAARAGLHRTDQIENDPDEGPVEVWERSRE